MDQSTANPQQCLQHLFNALSVLPPPGTNQLTPEVDSDYMDVFIRIAAIKDKILTFYDSLGAKYPASRPALAKPTADPQHAAALQRHSIREALALSTDELLEAFECMPPESVTQFPQQFHRRYQAIHRAIRQQAQAQTRLQEKLLPRAVR